MLAVATGLVSTAAPASAHATVVTSSPADGARLDASPPVLSFDLNEPVSLVEGSAQLIDIDGVRYPFAAQKLDESRQRIVLTVADPVPDGSYLATARVVSADTHVVSLSIRFTVGTAQAGQWADAGSGPVVNRFVLYPIKIAVYLGLVGSAGVFLVSRWVWPGVIALRRFRIVYRTGLGLLTVGLLGRLAVLVVEQAGGLSTASSSAIAAIAATPFGTALVAAGALSLLALAYPPSSRRLALTVGFLHATAAITAVTLGGHGGSTEVWPLPFFATFIHVYAVAVWLGGIAVVALVFGSVPNLSRWHRVAVGHVALVVIAGTTLALLQVRPVAAVATTSYGLTLLVKIALVAAAAVAAYFAWRHHTGSRMRTVLVEAALVVLVIAVTSSLSSLTPAKDSYTTNVATRLDFGGDDELLVNIDTVRRGAQTVTVEYPGADADVSVEFSSAQANVARLPVELSAARDDDGAQVWTSDGLIVPSPGQWKVTVRFDDGRGSPKLASFSYEVL